MFYTNNPWPHVYSHANQVFLSNRISLEEKKIGIYFFYLDTWRYLVKFVSWCLYKSLKSGPTQSENLCRAQDLILFHQIQTEPKYAASESQSGV